MNYEVVWCRGGDETGCHIAAHINNDNDKWRQRMSRNDEAVVTKEGPDDASCIVWAFGMLYIYIYFFSFAFIFVNKPFY
jgi:hypothetical protein